MLDVLGKLGPYLGVPVAALLLVALRRRVRAGRVDPAMGAALGVGLVLALLGVLVAPRVVFQAVAGYPDPYFVWAWVGLGLGSVATGALLTGALIGDRARGRRRCPSCWYDMSASPTPVCPECGHDAGSERGLLQTRRSRRLIVVSVLPLLAGGTFYGEWLSRQRNWAQAMPTVVLSLASAWADGRNDLGGELSRRMAEPGVNGFDTARWERWVQARVSGVVLRVSSRPDSLVYHADLMLGIGRPHAVPTSVAVALTRDANEYTVHHGAYLLGQIRDDTAAAQRALLGLVKDPRHHVRERAIYSLCELKGEDRGGPVPREVLEHARSSLVVEAALSLLGMYDPNPESRRLLVDAARTGTAWTSASAVSALTHQYPDDPDVRAILIEELRKPANDPDRSIIAHLRAGNQDAMRRGGATMERRRALYTPEVRAAIIAALRALPYKYPLGGSLETCGFSDAERWEIRRIMDGLPDPPW